MHNPTKSYIINAAALYSAEVHRWLSNRTLHEVQPAEWVQAISMGLAIWKAQGVAASADPVTQASQSQIAQAAAAMPGALGLCALDPDLS